MNISNASNLFNDKVVYDLQKFTHLDYPGHLACIVWFSACNMRCDFCYNKDIVFAKSAKYSMNNVLEFLQNRIGLLEAVVLSGGEATLHKLKEFCIEIKKLGFLIKLDTNGTHFELIKELVEAGLVDFFAIDYKAPQYKFKQITHSNKFFQFSKTIDFIIHSQIEYEIRTTLHNDLLDVHDVNFIIEDLVVRGYTKTYYIQKFKEGVNIGNLEDSLKKFSEELLSKKLKIKWR